MHRYPQAIYIDPVIGPVGEFPGKGGAPAKLATASVETINEEIEVISRLTDLFPERKRRRRVFAKRNAEKGLSHSIKLFASNLADTVKIDDIHDIGDSKLLSPKYEIDFATSQANFVHQINRHNRELIRDSQVSRKAMIDKLNFESLEAYQESIKPLREKFAKEVIGQFDIPLSKMNTRSRIRYKKEKWTGYDVVLDVFPDVIAYGVLLLPNNMDPKEKRPVVVCQHGLEGRPKDTIENDHRAYHDYAAKLADEGFIVFAPQNPYIFTDRFRTLQRKANPIGKSLFSIIAPQHQQIVNFLKSHPNVDPNRIGFYGLSYGGKSAMRIPALVEDYCLSICSADFNEWVWKNSSTKSNYSYVRTGEYEIFEFDLAGTFNYAEMAALICPRPFMVERGHFDGVAPDPMVAYEYAKVRNLYAAKLKISERTAIEFFVGPHTINGKGTFEFLRKHLDWPEK